MNGQRHGNGKQWLSNGNFYHGEFRDDIVQGLGTYDLVYQRLTLPSRLKYRGQFKDGVQHGRGMITLPNESEEPIRGIWENGNLL